MESSLRVTDVTIAHGIFLLVTQTHPDNLSIGRPREHILVFENYLESHPVSHLKTANTAKQMKLLLGSPLGTLFIRLVHMAIYNVQLSLLLSLRSQLRSYGRREQWCRGERTMEPVGCACTLSPPRIRICKDAHPSSATQHGLLPMS